MPVRLPNQYSPSDDLLSCRSFESLQLEHQTNFCLRHRDVPFQKLLRTALASGYLGRHSRVKLLPRSPQLLHPPEGQEDLQARRHEEEVKEPEGPSYRRAAPREPAAEISDHRHQREACKQIGRGPRFELEHPALGWGFDLDNEARHRSLEEARRREVGDLQLPRP